MRHASIYDGYHCGDTVIFRDGVYDETVRTDFAVDGCTGNPVTFQAEHPYTETGHAKIVYHDLPFEKLFVRRSHIVVEGFEVTQTQPGADFGARIVQVSGTADGGGGTVTDVVFRGIWAHGAKEGFKAGGATFVTFERNLATDVVIGFGSLASDDILFLHNDVVDATLD